MGPVTLPLSVEDCGALREFLAYYRAHATLLARRSQFPFLDASTVGALLDDHWGPYLGELRNHAMGAASAGLSFAEWFEVAANHRRAVLAALSESEGSPDAAAILVRGLDRLLEIAIQTISQTYNAIRLQHESKVNEHRRATHEIRSYAMSTREPVASPALTGARVLLVEDDRALLRTLGRAVRRNGHDATEVESGRQALAALQSESFDVIVSDIYMPDGGGLDLLRGVRRVDLDVPVILISGVADLSSAASALAYGAFRYLSKPLDLGELEHTIRHAWRAHALARLRRRAAAETGNHVGAADRAGLEVRFEQAMGGMWIAFQPIVEARSGALFGVEALLRSNEPSLPSPGAMLDAASNLGRTSALGRRVRALAADGVSAHRDLQLFVNLHPDDLTDADLIAGDASLSKIAPRVILEVTERSALHASPELASRIARLREIGFRLAVDDIGAGYSGLTSFADLMPEIVKIDMALVRNIHESMHRQRTVRALCNLCHEVSCLVIGEGVETSDERDCLIALGCDLLQGYLLGRPHAELPEQRLGDLV